MGEILTAEPWQLGSPVEGGQRGVWPKWRKPISGREVLLSSIVLVLLGAALVAFVSPYPYYPCCFHQLSAGIRHWDFRGLDPSQPKEFWGFAYLSALVATISRLPDIYAIVVVSSCMFVLANYLCARLWGTTVAAWFMVVNWWYIDGAVEGLTESLFMALVFGSFLAIRKERWALAALLASGATVVRPVGIFALLALGIVLLRRKQFWQLAIATAIGLVIGIAYLIPMKLIFDDPLANVRGYRTEDWSGSLPVSLPLLSLSKGALNVVLTWRTVHGSFVWKPFVTQIVIAGWVLFSLVGVIKMAADKRFWHYAKIYPAESIFAAAYAVFLFSYNSQLWAWEFFGRFVIPLVPFLILAFLNRLPRDRRILWGLALFNVALSVWLKAPPIRDLLRLTNQAHQGALL